jgi:hypothetical protein
MDATRRPGIELLMDKVKSARAMSFEDKFLAGPRLFETICRVMCDGIRMQYPGADEAEVQRHLRERLAINRRLEARPR